MDCFLAVTDKKPNMGASTKTTQKLYHKYSDVFSYIWCFKGTFSFQVKEGMKPYQAMPMYMV